MEVGIEIDVSNVAVDNIKNGHRYEVLRLVYDDIKQMMERRLAQQKCGMLNENKISHSVKD